MATRADGLTALDPALRGRHTPRGVTALVPVYESLPARGGRPELIFLRQGDDLYLYNWNPYKQSWILLASPPG